MEKDKERASVSGQDMSVESQPQEGSGSGFCPTLGGARRGRHPSQATISLWGMVSCWDYLWQAQLSLGWDSRHPELSGHIYQESRKILPVHTQQYLTPLHRSINNPPPYSLSNCIFFFQIL